MRISPVKFTMVLISIILFTYTTYRAINLSLTFDEAYTFQTFVHTNIFDILTNNFSAEIANNHIVNTILVKIFYNFFGNTEFVLRLPSLIGHLLYLFFTFIFVEKFVKSKTAKITSFILLNLNIFLLDFFSLARGYALAAGLVASSVYFLIEYLSNRKKRIYLFASLITSWLSVLTNFTLLNYFIALISFLFCLSIFENIRMKQNFFGRVKKILYNSYPIIIITVTTFLSILIPLGRVVKRKLLYYGGDNNFVSDTIGSLVRASLYKFNLSPTHETILTILIF
ncbi:hypothetical protein JW796_02420 [Candidatus Dojkabacteria bacterium]|nr:hypothetical protein [Candidatus Dojkabacteria bacterium]